jgi:mRNA-degrading endonuclease toxin of MazEF toxin-antitoxin module
MRRGEIWSYKPVTARRVSTLRLIVSADAINESEAPVILGLHVVDEDPESLLAPSVGGHGWAVVTTIERVLKMLIGEHVGTATPEQMEQVNIALRAALALD